MERRLSEPPLTQMELVLAREQAVSEQSSRALEAAALVEVLLVRDEHVADQVRMIEQVQVLRADLVVRDVTVALVHSDHHRQWIPRDLDQELERVARGRTVREGGAIDLALRRAKAGNTHRV